MKKAFSKMGIVSQTEVIKSMPSQEERRTHRMNKYMELKKKYYRKKF